MNTWTSKVWPAALVCLALAGCSAEGLIGGTTPTGDGSGGGTGDGAPAVRSAPLNRGAIMLVAPNGFCIDTASLRARFALMARCDTLGASGADDAPLALITATTIAAAAGRPVQASDLGAGDETVIERMDRDGVTLVRVEGTPPGPDLRPTYWRAASRVGSQVLGLAIYEAVDGPSLGPRAPRLLEQTLRRTQDETVATTVAGADNSATPPDNNRLPGFLGGLFE